MIKVMTIFIFCTFASTQVYAENTADIEARAPANLGYIFLTSLQNNNFPVLRKHYYPYVRRLQYIHNNQPKILWEKLENNLIVQIKKENLLKRDWGLLINGNIAHLETRQEKSKTEQPYSVYFKVTYSTKEESPTVVTRLAKAFLIQLTIKPPYVMGLTRIYEGDELWPDIEETRIIVAQRLLKSANYSAALRVLDNPKTTKGKHFRAKILNESALNSNWNKYTIQRLVLNAVDESIRLNPKLKERWWKDGLQGADNLFMNGRDDAVEKVLNHMLLLFSNNSEVIGRLVRLNLVASASWLCHGGGARNNGNLDKARKLGADSTTTNILIDKLLRIDGMNISYSKKCIPANGLDTKNRFIILEMQSIPPAKLARD